MRSRPQSRPGPASPQRAVNRLVGARVLVVDDDLRSADAVASVLRDRGARVSVATDAYEALTRLTGEPFDAVVLEVALPGGSGLDLLEALEPRVPAVLVTAFAARPVARRARDAGARAVLRKPVDETELVTAVRSALASHQH
jgi:CheY-like chemotaxis protein